MIKEMTQMSIKKPGSVINLPLNFKNSANNLRQFMLSKLLIKSGLHS